MCGAGRAPALPARRRRCLAATATGSTAAAARRRRRSSTAARPGRERRSRPRTSARTSTSSAAAAATRSTAIATPSFYVALLHRDNACGAEPRGAVAGQPRPLDDVARPRRRPRVLRRPAQRRDRRGAAHGGCDRGHLAAHVHGLRRLRQHGGVPRPRDGARRRDGERRRRSDSTARALPPSSRRCCAALAPGPGLARRCFCWPRRSSSAFAARRDLFVNTMWESNRLPPQWLGPLNRARARDRADAFRRPDVCRRERRHGADRGHPRGRRPGASTTTRTRPERERASRR